MLRATVFHAVINSLFSDNVIVTAWIMPNHLKELYPKFKFRLFEFHVLVLRLSWHFLIVIAVVSSWFSSSSCGCDIHIVILWNAKVSLWLWTSQSRPFLHSWYLFKCFFKFIILLFICINWKPTFTILWFRRFSNHILFFICPHAFKYFCRINYIQCRTIQFEVFKIVRFSYSWKLNPDFRSVAKKEIRNYGYRYKR